MNEAVEIVQLSMPYLSYVAAPLFLFSALACADLMTGFVIGVVKQVRNHYRL